MAGVRWVCITLGLATCIGAVPASSAHNPDLVPHNPLFAADAVTAAAVATIAATGQLQPLVQGNVLGAVAVLSNAAIPFDEGANLTAAASLYATQVLELWRRAAAEAVNGTADLASTTAAHIGHIIFHVQELAITTTHALLNVTKALLLAACEQPLDAPTEGHPAVLVDPESGLPPELPTLPICAHGSIASEARNAANVIYKAILPATK